MYQGKGIFTRRKSPKRAVDEVVAVVERYETKNIHEPHEHCTIQEVPIYGQDQGANIVGAIIGGYIGSKIGGGKGNDIITSDGETTTKSPGAGEEHDKQKEICEEESKKIPKVL